jgi:hypothetical protein
LVTLSRRKIFVIGAGFIAAPAIIRCTSLMPVKTWIDDEIISVIIPVICSDGAIGSRLIGYKIGRLFLSLLTEANRMGKHVPRTTADCAPGNPVVARATQPEHHHRQDRGSYA